jgi:hypothetical protein
MYTMESVEHTIRDVRTYSHALLTWVAARRLVPSGPNVAAWGALGAALPDLPVIAGALWLGARRRRWPTRQVLCEEACEKGPFREPDAALHSALPAVLLLTLCLTSGTGKRRPAPPAFFLGWLGHVLADALTHAQDARPILWPLSRRRFRGPVSYWDRAHYALPFALAEHGALLFVAAWMSSRNFPETG